MAKQMVEVLLNGIKMAYTKLIAYKSIIDHNHAIDFTGACSNFSDQVGRLHGGSQMEVQR